MKRYEVINWLIENMGYKKYLEIGVDDPELCFNKVICEKKTGVDPYEDKLGTHQWTEDQKQEMIDKVDGELKMMTSDDFFASLTRNKFDLIFIDGLHKEEQVDKDIENALKHLSKNGVIMLHDTLPKNEMECMPEPEFGQPWTGTVFRSFWKLRQFRSDLDLFTLDFETGLSFVRPGVNQIYSDPKFPDLRMSFTYLKMYRDKLMNVVTWEKFKTYFSA